MKFCWVSTTRAQVHNYAMTCANHTAACNLLITSRKLKLAEFHHLKQFLLINRSFLVLYTRGCHDLTFTDILGATSQENATSSYNGNAGEALWLKQHVSS